MLPQFKSSYSYKDVNSSRIVINCSANFSSLRIEDPKKGRGFLRCS